MKIDLSSDEREYLIGILHGRAVLHAKAIKRKLTLSRSPLGEIIEKLHAYADGNWDPTPSNLDYMLTQWASELERIAEKELTRV